MEELDPLVAEYQKTIPQKLDALKKCIQLLVSQPNKETLEAFRAVVHKLAGNSGTYGYLTVSKFCKQLELDAKSRIDNIAQLLPEKEWLESLQITFSQIEKAFSKPDLNIRF